MRLRDDEAVKNAVTATAAWILDGGWRNVVIEIANECNIPHEYTHSRLMRGENVHQLIALAQSIKRDGRRLLVSSSFVDITYFRDHNPDAVFVTPEVLQLADFVIIHGNGAPYPGRLRELADQVRATPAWRPRPIVVNEDDHFDFDLDDNHMKAALRAHLSWGYFDPGSITTWPSPQPTVGDYLNGYQAVPINWGPSTPLKKAFFRPSSPPPDPARGSGSAQTSAHGSRWPGRHSTPTTQHHTTDTPALGASHTPVDSAWEEVQIMAMVSPTRQGSSMNRCTASPACTPTTY